MRSPPCLPAGRYKIFSDIAALYHARFRACPISVSFPWRVRHCGQIKNFLDSLYVLIKNLSGWIY